MVHEIRQKFLELDCVGAWTPQSPYRVPTPKTPDHLAETSCNGFDRRSRSHRSLELLTAATGHDNVAEGDQLQPGGSLQIAAALPNEERAGQSGQAIREKGFSRFNPTV